jgi:hypothetical protein
MGRGPKPAKGKAKPTVVRKPPKNDGARIRDREKQLAEALRDKAEALEQQTATADILRVIKRSPTDVQPVFDAIIGSAVRLCGALYGIVWRYDGEMVHLGAGHNLSATELRELQDRHPRPIAIRDDIHRMMLMGRMIEVPDVEQASDVPAFLLASWRRRGVRSAVLVPMQGDRRKLKAPLASGGGSSSRSTFETLRRSSRPSRRRSMRARALSSCSREVFSTLMPGESPRWRRKTDSPPCTHSASMSKLAA